MEREVLSKQTSILGTALRDQKVSERSVPQKKNEILAWLLLFAKHVGDKPPDEIVTVLPYRQIKPIWEEYVDNRVTGKKGMLTQKRSVCAPCIVLCYFSKRFWIAHR